MLKKRIIGIVTVLDNWAVQSFGYNRYLPIGKPEHVVENLDRWGVDEILIQVIDRSIKKLGVNLEFIKNISSRHVSTPLIYSGGISSSSEAIKIIRAGFERICLDTLLHTNIEEVYKIHNKLGSQAVIASIPIKITRDGQAKWYNYRTKEICELSDEIKSLVEKGIVSEVMLIDYKNEGSDGEFDFRVSSIFENKRISMILFGGLNSIKNIKQALLIPRVSAIGIGNSFNYQEHAVQKIKEGLSEFYVREPFYENEEY